MGLRKRGRPLRAAIVAAAALACASAGPFVWADAVPEAAPPRGGEYVLAPGDSVLVRVFNHETVSGRCRVRPDGRITVPLINDVQAAGRTTQELAADLTKLLREYIKEAVVTVSLDEIGVTQLSVIGEVARPGVYAVERDQGVLRALAAASGLTEFAHKDRIYLVRSGAPGRIRFSLDALSLPGSRSARFRVQGNDVVLVQ